jgi:hypothetical protein
MAYSCLVMISNISLISCGQLLYHQHTVHLVCTTAEAEVNSTRSPEPREQLVILGYLDTALTQKLFPRGKRIKPSGLGV